MVEVAAAGVHVSTVLPAATRTAMTKVATIATTIEKLVPGLLDRVLARVDADAVAAIMANIGAPRGEVTGSGLPNDRG